MAEKEAVLLRRFARTGDAEAFAEIIRRYAGLVYGAALRILADMDRAADVAQETFLQLTKDAGAVTGSLPGWLHRVATHKAIDQMRRETSRRRRETAYMASRRREVAEWKDISPYVDEGLNELDPEMRDILVAHFLEGRTTRHIAGVRGISQATVSRRIEAGVASLRGVLRRRGIIVAAGALSLLLGENAVKAAPAALMAELGKIALVGGHVAAVSTAATAGSSLGLQTAVSGVLAGIKANAVAVAAVAVIGAGSVMTYRQVTKPSAASMPETVITTVAPPPRPVASSPAVAPTRATSADGSSESARQWQQMIAAATDGAGAQNTDGSIPPVPVSQSQANAASGGETPPAGAAYGGMGGLAVPADPHAEPIASEEGPPVGGMGMGMMGGSASYRAVGAAPPPERDPNDSNDRSEDDDNEKKGKDS